MSSRQRRPNLILCWSGDRSRKVTEILVGWLDNHYPKIKPFYSGMIPQGSMWHEELRVSLAEVRAGIICLTPENLDSKWLHYEAGMLGQKMQSEEPSVYPLLFGGLPAPLTGPLSHIQLARLGQRAEVEGLLGKVLKRIQDGKREVRIEDETWLELQDRLAAVGPESIKSVLPDLDRRFRRKTFEEPIDACLSMQWIERYAGAWETLAYLRERREIVRARVAAHVADMYDDLTTLLDRYTMVMRSSLLDEARHFKRRKEGRLRMPVAIRKPCEDARAGVQALLREILDPVAPPVQKDMAREYKRRRGYSGGTYHLQFQLEQMMALLAPIKGEAELSPKEPSEAERLLPHLSDIETDAASLLRSRTSPWAFDRMVYYLAQTRCSSKTGRGPEWRKAGVFADRRKAIRAIDQECEYVRASLHDPKTRDLHPFQLDLHPLQFALLALSSFEGEQRFEPEPAHDPDSPESATGTQQQVERLVLLLQEHLKKLDASERQIVELELERLIACAKRLREVHQDGE